MIMPWGKFVGYDLGDIPNNYLEWLLDNIEIKNRYDSNLHDAVMAELRERDEIGLYLEDWA